MKSSLWSRVLGAPAQRRDRRARQLRGKPTLELLEERSLLSTYFVTTTADSGAGSLRQAILDTNANNTVSNQTVFQNVAGPIDLLSELPAIDDDVSLSPEGGGNVTVERSSAGYTPAFRIFKINAGRTVSMTGLTVANGLVQGDVGGGILNQGTLTLAQSTITGNTAEHSGMAGGLGGGIDNEGSLTVLNSSITGNAAALSGGGLLNGGLSAATLEGVTISQNAQTFGVPNASEDGSAGGIASLGALTMRDSLISKNAGGTGGLALMAFGADVLISQCVIADNTHTPTGIPFAAGMVIEGFGGNVRIENSLIMHNIGNGANGAILSFGGTPLELVASTITGNIGGTGGINTTAGGQIVDSTISNNTGDFAGGVNCAFAPLEIVRSTISGNVAVAHHAYAAGGVSTLGPLTIDDSTISGNTVLAAGMTGSFGSAAGGILVGNNPFFGGPTSIDHSTIAFNRVVGSPPSNFQVAGGVSGSTYLYNGYQYPANVQVRNTIIAKNVYNLSDPDVTGTFLSGGHNLIGVLGSSATGFVASDLSGTSATPLDPRLLPLANNGGPTKTHALRSDSPAVNAGDNANAPLTDQRGYARIDSDGIIDIGAYELQHSAGSTTASASSIAAVSTGPPSASIGDLVGSLQQSATPSLRTNAGAKPPPSSRGSMIQGQLEANTQAPAVSLVNGLVLFGGESTVMDDPFLNLTKPQSQ
jgi:hypothetical protein